MRFNERNKKHIAAEILSRLSAQGLDFILAGGAAVEIHATGEYVTHDLDMVARILYNVSHKNIIEATMNELGFTRRGHTRHFQHPDLTSTVEFLQGPGMVGNELVTLETVQDDVSGKFFKMVSEQDMVRDRLLWYYWDNDEHGLLNAVNIVKKSI